MSAAEDLGVYLLDVGQGDATVVLPPGWRQRAVLFDCKDGFVVERVLRTWGVERIAALVLSHLDLDHIAGCSDILQRFPIDAVYVCADRDITDSHEDAQRAKALIDEIQEGGAQGRWTVLPSSADPRPILAEDDWSIQIVAPSYAQRLSVDRRGGWEDANQYSAVLRIERAGKVALIGGDATLQTWSQIPVARRRADVFRVPHHGGALDDGGAPDEWNSQRLYEEINPSEAVLSVGSNNPYEHPNARWVSPILHGQRRLRCTQVTARCQTGLLEGDVQLLREELLSGDFFAEPPWRHLTDRTAAPRKGLREVPCAGTVVIIMNADGRMRILPSQDSGHKQVVDGWLHPLCGPPQVPVGPDEGAGGQSAAVVGRGD